MTECWLGTRVHVFWITTHLLTTRSKMPKCCKRMSRSISHWKQIKLMKQLSYFCFFILYLLLKTRPVAVSVSQVHFYACTAALAKLPLTLNSWPRHWSFKCNKPKYMDFQSERMDFHTPLYSSGGYALKIWDDRQNTIYYVIVTNDGIRYSWVGEEMHHRP